MSGAGIGIPALPSCAPLLLCALCSSVPLPICILAFYLLGPLQVARATGVADEALGNVRTVRAFAMEQREEE